MGFPLRRTLASISSFIDPENQKTQKHLHKKPPKRQKHKETTNQTSILKKKHSNAFVGLKTAFRLDPPAGRTAASGEELPLEVDTKLGALLDRILGGGGGGGGWMGCTSNPPPTATKRKKSAVKHVLLQKNSPKLMLFFNPKSHGFSSPPPKKKKHMFSTMFNWKDRRLLSKDSDNNTRREGPQARALRRPPWLPRWHRRR